MVRRATCCCGKCSIEVEGEPVVNAICHCDNCKRRTGSAFGWNAYFLDSQIVRAEGEFTGYAIDGVNRQLRWFCSDCGTTLYWKVAAFLPEHTGVAGGAFADTPLAVPTASVSNEGRCTWLHLPGVPTNVALGTR